MTESTVAAVGCAQAPDLRRGSSQGKRRGGRDLQEYPMTETEAEATKAIEAMAAKRPSQKPSFYQAVTGAFANVAARLAAVEERLARLEESK
jgi:hypothetical protein